MSSRPPTSALSNTLRLGAALGAVVWPLWWVLGGVHGGMLGEIGFALAGALAVVAPLALMLAREPDRDGRDSRAWAWAAGSWVASAPLGLLALLGEPGALSVGLALPWLGTTLLAGAFGVRRLGRRPHLQLDALCVDLGLIYLPVGGIWLVASRAGQPLLGFAEPWTSLTAAHFHFAGLGVPLLAGLVGRALVRLRDEKGEMPFGLERTWRVSAWAAVLGPPLTALGIATVSVVEMAGALIMLAGAVGTAGFMLVLAVSSDLPSRARAVFAVAGAVPVGTSALALLWALSQFFGADPFPSLGSMVRYHGVVNAVVFIAAGLTGFALSGVQPTGHVPGIPFSRLRAGASVGRWFFRSHGLVDETSTAPVGLVDDAAVFSREGVPGLHDLDPVDLHPLVRRFYEETAAFELAVIPRWPMPASLVAPMVRAAARSIGQLELPTDPLLDRGMEGELVPLHDAPDGRVDVRGWIRLHRGTERPVFVSAYSHHRHGGVPYVNIAMPLPGSNLTSILRVDPGTLGGIVFTTRRRRGFAGDAGIFWVTPVGELRLPMHETLILGPAAGRDGELAARHQIHVLGLLALELTYLVTPRDAD
ncbi:MAG: YndJ family protein [Deltaproteobacteria bacterium]|nr:YndJ family protein [Deltaproteobacteria bacterium]